MTNLDYLRADIAKVRKILADLEPYIPVHSPLSSDRQATDALLLDAIAGLTLALDHFANRAQLEQRAEDSRVQANATRGTHL